MTGTCLLEVPSSAAAGHGTNTLPDPGPESDVVLPPRSAPTNRMSALFGLFMQFMSTHNLEFISSFGDAPGPAAAAPGVPTSVTPFTPPASVCAGGGGGGGEFGSGLRSLSHALRAVGACEVAGP